MENVVESRMVEVLRQEPTYTMPVSALHGALIAELGRGPSGYGQLAAAIADRPDLFVVMEPSDPLGAVPGWAPELRTEYYAELKAAGYDPEPRIALVAPDPLVHEPCAKAVWSGALAFVDATLVTLWASDSSAVALRMPLSAALTEIEELRRRLAQDA